MSTDSIRIEGVPASSDERDGMAWWNGLTEGARGMWLRTLGVMTVADAWARHKTDVIAEQAASEARVIDEANEYIVSSDDSIVVGAITDLITDHPHLFAMRFLRLEREVEELRQRVDAIARVPEIVRPMGAR